MSGSSPPLPAEFRFIARHFAPLAGPGALGLSDDAALLHPPPDGRHLVVAADAMVENVHFLPDDDPHDLGRKLLRANLSDLAAMGAAPLGYLLTLAVPSRCDDAFFSRLVAGLALDQAEYGVFLLGGDTTRTAGPLVMSLTILGTVGPGREVRRAGARPGDLVLVTGTIGDGALGLLALRGEVADPTGFLVGRYHLPAPRLAYPLGGLATSAIDVSDGLLQDAGHLARAGGVTLIIEAETIPLSAAARALGPDWRALCLGGGDDYELLFTIGPDALDRALALGRDAGIAATPIGVVREGASDVVLLAGDGSVMTNTMRGYSHF